MRRFALLPAFCLAFALAASGCTDYTLLKPAQEITIQLPVILTTNSFGPLPKTNIDRATLADYQAYSTNTGKITKIELIQTNFMFRDLAAQVSQTNAIPLSTEQMQVSSIDFTIQAGGNTREYGVASFKNVWVKDYMLTPQPAEVSRETSDALSEALKTQAQITLTSRYGALAQGSAYFTKIQAQIELVFRITVKP